MISTPPATGSHPKRHPRQGPPVRVSLMLTISLAIHPITVLADVVISSGAVVLRVVSPRVTEIRDGSPTECPRTPGDGHGRGRPGAQGLIQIFGIGLAGVTAITFEGEGVSGEILDRLGSDALNPSLLVKITIAERAALGPRRFTLVTPDQRISSGEIAFIVQPPEITDVSDPEGAPGSSGRIEVCGVGLDDVTEIRVSGSGVTATIESLPPSDGLSVLNPALPVTLRIASDAAVGPRTLTFQTRRGDVSRSDVIFTVTAPRIDAILEGNNFAAGRGFSLSGEGAPGTSGRVFITGIGLGGARAIQFTGDGITGRMEPDVPGENEKLNPLIPVWLTIEPSAAVGPHAFSLVLPRAPGVVESSDNDVSFAVTPPRIDFLADDHNLSQASPGACGIAFVGGVGIRDLTDVTFDAPGGVTARVLPRRDEPPVLNEPAPIHLTVAPTAVLGSRRFSVTTPRARIGSGTTVWTVAPPQILFVSTESEASALSPARFAQRTDSSLWRDVVRSFRNDTAHKEPLRRRWAIGPDRAFGTAVMHLQVSPLLGNEAAPGSRGRVLIVGVGLYEAVQIEFIGGGVRPVLLEAAEPALNPSLRMRVEIENQAALGERAFVLRLTGANSQCR